MDLGKIATDSGRTIGGVGRLQEEKRLNGFIKVKLASGIAKEGNHLCRTKKRV